MTTSSDREAGKAIVRHGRAFLPGIIANDLSGDIQAQTREAFKNVDACLAEIGSDRTRVLMVHIWLSDMALFQDMTSVWNDWVDADIPPSRSCVRAKPITENALLEVIATAAVPSTVWGRQPIERFGMVRGPGRPTMCLGLGIGDWYTVCIIAPDCTTGIVGQTQQILQMFDDYLAEAGTDKAHLLTAEIWLKNMVDIDAVNAIWREWLGNAGRPAVSLVRADMAQPEMLIEIRITAAR